MIYDRGKSAGAFILLSALVGLAGATGGWWALQRSDPGFFGPVFVATAAVLASMPFLSNRLQGAFDAVLTRVRESSSLQRRANMARYIQVRRSQAVTATVVMGVAAGLSGATATAVLTPATNRALAGEPLKWLVILTAGVVAASLPSLARTIRFSRQIDGFAHDVDAQLEEEARREQALSALKPLSNGYQLAGPPSGR